MPNLYNLKAVEGADQSDKQPDSSIKTPSGFPYKKTFFLIFVAAVAGAVFYAYKNNFIPFPKKQEAQELSEIDRIVMEVRGLVEVPDTEMPTMATISDKSKLSDVKFFQKSMNGDKLLVFQQARQAVIYRPTTRKIVNVTFLAEDEKTAASEQDLAKSIAEPQSLPVVPVASSSPLKILYLNGTKTSGLAAATEKKIKEKYPTSVTVATKNAKTQDYPETLVIAIKSLQAEHAAEIAELLKAKVTTLPKTEDAQDADLVIINGSK